MTTPHRILATSLVSTQSVPSVEDFNSIARKRLSQRTITAVTKMMRYKSNWLAVPVTWWDVMREKNLTGDSYVKLAHTMYVYFKYGMVRELPCVTLQAIESRYINLIRALMESPSTGFTKVCNYYAGNLDDNPAKANSYRYVANGNTLPVPVEGDLAAPTDVNTSTMRMSSPFAEYQLDALSNSVTFDIVGAIEELLTEGPIGHKKYLIRHFIELYMNRHYCTTGRTGRIFHTISNLKSQYRKYARIDGKECTDLDIRASQPSILASMLLALGVQGAGAMWEITNRERLYDYLYDKYSPSCGRKAYKTSFLTYMFADATLTSRLPIAKHMSMEFPGVHRYIMGLKLSGGNSHVELSHRMQRIESELVYDVVRQLGCPAVTIHDSIMVPKDHALASHALFTQALVDRNIPSSITMST